jgi:hypothetical protein
VAFDKTDGADLCDESFSGICSRDDYRQFNGVYEWDGVSERDAPSVTSSGNCPTVNLGGGPSARNHVFVNEDFKPLGAYNEYANSSQSCWQGGFQGFVHPFVFAPGAMHERFGWKDRVATVYGPGHGTFNASTMSTRIIPEADSLVPDDWAFRLEFVGDLIIDCGHHPLRTEIHPPTNVLMHLSTPTMVHEKRYSVFGWNRQGNGQVDAAEFDLWPGPAPRGKSKLVYKVLYPTGPDLPSANLVCAPYPLAAPNRIRCRVPPGDTAGDTDVCGDNQRMHPSCATSVGGGLVQVLWE